MIYYDILYYTIIHYTILYCTVLYCLAAGDAHGQQHPPQHVGVAGEERRAERGSRLGELLAVPRGNKPT